MNAPVASASVHANGDVNQLAESFPREVLPKCHPPDNGGEREELLFLATQQRVSLEGDDFL